MSKFKKKFAPLWHFLLTLCRFTLRRAFDPMSFDPLSVNQFP